MRQSRQWSAPPMRRPSSERIMWDFGAARKSLCAVHRASSSCECSSCCAPPILWLVAVSPNLLTNAERQRSGKKFAIVGGTHGRTEWLNYPRASHWYAVAMTPWRMWWKLLRPHRLMCVRYLATMPDKPVSVCWATNKLKRWTRIQSTRLRSILCSAVSIQSCTMQYMWKPYKTMSMFSLRRNIRKLFVPVQFESTAQRDILFFNLRGNFTFQIAGNRSVCCSLYDCYLSVTRRTWSREEQHQLARKALESRTRLKRQLRFCCKRITAAWLLEWLPSPPL